jgi:alpha-L-rhamnosidase
VGKCLGDIAMVDDIGWTKAWYEAPNGRIQSEWSNGDEQKTMKVSIPVNTTATVVIPSIQVDGIAESGTQISNHPDILEIRSEKEDTRVRLGSGDYVFKFPK